jgi:hypothetical protein
MAKTKKNKKTGIVSRIGEWQSKVFKYVSKKAKTSKLWAIILTALVIYELIEHLVYPWLVPLLAIKAFG